MRLPRDPIARLAAPDFSSVQPVAQTLVERDPRRKLFPLRRRHRSKIELEAKVPGQRHGGAEVESL